MADGHFVDPAPMTRRVPDQGDPNVHYTLDIRVHRIEKVTSKANVLVSKTGETTERIVTELGHVVLSDKVLAYLIKKGAKALELIGE